MTEIAGDSSTDAGDAGTAAAAAAVAAAPTSATQTVEDVEAIWKGRMSGRDRAHAAEVAELRRQLDARGAAPSAATSASETPEQTRIRELEATIEKANMRAAVAERKSRFPLASAELGDDIAHIDEARLARVEARLSAEDEVPPARMDPNSARKGTPTAPKSIEDMNEDELQAQLRAMGPAYKEYLDSIR